MSLPRKNNFIQLRPVRAPQIQIEEIEKRIKLLFKEEIFIPLMKSVGVPFTEIQNTIGVPFEMNQLYQALSSGKITYNKEIFSGSFTAQTSKALRSLGAKWDRNDSTFHLEKEKLPNSIIHAVRISEDAFSQKLEKVGSKLSQILESEPWKKRNFSDLFDKALFKMDKEFRENVKRITVTPTLTQYEAEKISKEWQENLELWIKNFTEEKISSLRQKVRESVFKGDRYGGLVKTIQDAYGVSANKAEFLARQETKLLTVKYAEGRYTQAGVTEYYWRCVPGTLQHPTRPRHKALSQASDNGKTYRWDDPPVTTEPGEPERRNNPGEDYNCRCVAIPIVKARK